MGGPLTASREDLSGPVLDVAPRLLGAHLTAGGMTVRLTEVEAYAGEADPYKKPRVIEDDEDTDVLYDGSDLGFDEELDTVPDTEPDEDDRP